MIFSTKVMVTTKEKNIYNVMNLTEPHTLIIIGFEKNKRVDKLAEPKADSTHDTSNLVPDISIKSLLKQQFL